MPPKPSLKERRKELRHAAIIDAARELLVSKGYAAMTLEDVSAEVGVSKPTLYLHFSSKEELAVCVLVEAMKNAEEQLKLLEVKLTPAQTMKTMIELAIDRHFGPGIQAHFSGSLPVFGHATLRQAEDSLVSAMAATIKRAQSKESIANRAPPRLIAQTLLSILKDPVYEDSADGRPLSVASMKSGVVKLLLG